MSQKRREKRANKLQRIPLKLAAVLSAVAVLCGGAYFFLNIALFEEEALLKGLEFYNVDTSKAGFWSSQGAFMLKAKHNLQKGETIFQIPRFLCITEEDVAHSDIGKLLHQNIAAIDDAIKESGSSQGFGNVLRFAFYIASERRNGLSPLQRWFETIPPFDRASGGALFWSDEDLLCLDPATLWEAQVVQAGLVAANRVANLVCNGEDDCPGGVFSMEELRWGLAVYFHFNLRDQAVVPFVTFAKFTAQNFGIDVRLNRRSGGLDVFTNSDFLAGSEMGIYYPRGPGGQFVARGIVDSSSLGVDARIDLRSALSSNIGRKVCIDRAHELMFGVNGRPRDSLLKCYAWLIASEDERNVIDDFAANALLTQRVRNDLVHVLQEALKQVPASCDTSHRELRSKILALNNFTQVVLQKNLDHLSRS